MRRGFWLAALTVPLALVAGSIAVTGSARAGDGVAARNAAGDPLVLTGMVSRGSGTLDANRRVDPASIVRTGPVAGASVSLSLVLTPEDSRDGDTFPTAVNLRASTDPAGRYSLYLTPSAEVVAAAGKNSGWVNFYLGVRSGPDNKVESVSRHWNGSAWDSAGRSEFEPATPYATDILRDPRSGVSLQGTAGADGAVGPHAVVLCKWIQVYSEDAFTKIIEFHNSTSTTGRWEYGASADSDIDVGVQYAKNDDWMISGTAHIGNSQGAAVSSTKTGRYDLYGMTKFKYITLQAQPMGQVDPIWPTYCYDTDYLVNTKFFGVRLWLGGVDNVTAPLHRCADVAPDYRLDMDQGSSYRKYTARAQRVGIAVGFSFISLGATSGYSTNVDQSWSWQSRGQLCGKDAYPNDAKVIYVD